MNELENLDAGRNKNAFDDLSLDRLKNDGKFKKQMGKDGYPITEEGDNITPKDFVDTGNALIELYKKMREDPPSAQ